MLFLFINGKIQSKFTKFHSCWCSQRLQKKQIRVFHKLRLQQWGEGVHEMSTLLNKFGKFYQVKLSTRGGGGRKGKKSVNAVCERPLTKERQIFTKSDNFRANNKQNLFHFYDSVIFRGPLFSKCNKKVGLII